MDKKQCYAESILAYLKTHPSYERMTPEEAVIQAIRVMTDDIGAAQDFLNAIECPYDLYVNSERRD